MNFSLIVLLAASLLITKPSSELVLTEKQTEFVQALFGGKTRVLFGGAVGGAKTVGGLGWLYLACKIWPGSRWAIVRETRPVLKRNTIPSFWKHCPKPFFHPKRFNKSDLVATANNGSEIMFIPEDISGDPEGHKFDGYEINGALLEEGNELSKNTYLKLVDRIGRWILPEWENPPPPWIGITCNPHQGYLKDMFYDPYVNGTLPDEYAFIPALPTDNPYLTKAYLKNLEELKRIAPHLYRKRVLGSWEAEDDVQQLILWEHVYAAERIFDFEGVEEEEIFNCMGVDVGRNGRDPSVWYVLRGNPIQGFNILKRKSVPKTTGPEVKSITKQFIHDFEIQHDRVCLDAVGLGGPIVDEMVEDGYDIQGFVGGSTALPQFSGSKFGFNNLNSQVGWNLKTYFEKGLLGGITEDKLKNELTMYKFDIYGEKLIRVTGKEEMKKKLHRSPDDADSYRMALWAGIYDSVAASAGMV